MRGYIRRGNLVCRLLGRIEWMFVQGEVRKLEVRCQM